MAGDLQRVSFNCDYLKRTGRNDTANTSIPFHPTICFCPSFNEVTMSKRRNPKKEKELTLASFANVPLPVVFLETGVLPLARVATTSTKLQKTS
jgi:hypothetical protein